MKRPRKILSGAVTATAAFCLTLACYGATLTVVSSNNGTGRFSWSYTKGDEPFIWRLDSVNGTIGIQTYGVEQVFTPSGWSVSNDGNDFLQWTYTSGTWYVENTAVVFAVQSTFTNSTLYTNDIGEFFPKGTLIGTICDTDHVAIAPGLERHVITGPQPRPRFSTFNVSNSQAVFDIEEMMGRTCHVERTVNLTSNTWQETTNFTVQGLSTNVADPIPAMANPLFYRLRFTR